MLGKYILPNKYFFLIPRKLNQLTLQFFTAVSLVQSEKGWRRNIQEKRKWLTLAYFVLKLL